MNIFRIRKRRTNRVRAEARRMGIEHLEGRQLLTTVVALTEANVLLRVDSSNPSAILDQRQITGLQGGAGETIVGIDLRPANGQLYAVSNQGGTGRLYSVSATSGVATLVASLAADPTDATAPYTGLSGTDFGIDFNPVPDRLRVVSDADQNLRINPTNGQVITDTPLAYATGDANFGVNPLVVDIAYNNNVAGATTTTLFGIEGIDPDLHSRKTLSDGTVVPALTLVRQGDPGGAPTSPNSGLLRSLGPFGRNGARLKGFDIAPSGTAITAVELHFPDGVVNTALVLIDTATGADQALGRIGDGTVLIRDIAVVPSVQFTASLFATAEDAALVAITVVRTDGSAPISVEYATFDGSATAGADYVSVSGRLDFAAGEVTKTILIPIVNDTNPEDDETFGILLRNPISGETILGSPGVAQVRISANDRLDRTGPLVTQVLETGPSRGITGFRVQFNEDMNPDRAQNLANYSLFGIGRGGRRTPIALGSAVYDATQRSVTVRAAQAFMQTGFRQILVRISGRRNGLTDLAGNRLNGDRNRHPGGDAISRFDVFSGQSLSFRDRDGDRATISIANGGRLDGIRPVQGPSAQETQFWILDPIALRSTLSGNVQRGPRGDGLIVIAEIIGLDKKEFTPLLNNPSFRVNTLTFSSNATGIG